MIFYCPLDGKHTKILVRRCVYGECRLEVLHDNTFDQIGNDFERIAGILKNIIKLRPRNNLQRRCGFVPEKRGNSICIKHITVFFKHIHFYDFIAHTPYAAAGEALKESPTAFEKCCDDLFTAPLQAGKYGAFGVAPIAAFHYAVQTELLNVRILLSAKLNGAPDDDIRERMRKLYV